MKHNLFSDRFQLDSRDPGREFISNAAKWENFKEKKKKKKRKPQWPVCCCWQASNSISRLTYHFISIFSKCNMGTFHNKRPSNWPLLWLAFFIFIFFFQGTYPSSPSQIAKINQKKCEPHAIVGQNFLNLSWSQENLFDCLGNIDEADLLFSGRYRSCLNKWSVLAGERQRM